MSQLKAEYIKLLTVRSTYLLTALGWLILSIVSFYAVGYHMSPQELLNPLLLQNTVFGTVHFIGLIASIIGVLLLAHEYRYNTINYSLTISNSRTKVLASKFLVVSVYAIIFAVISVLLTIGLVHAGAASHGHTVGPQLYQFWHVLGQSVFYVWGSAAAALILVTLIRNLVGSIVALFIIPSIEGLLGQLLLKTNVGYLPFTALGSVTPLDHAATVSFSITKSVVIVVIYLVVFGIISWQLFLRRDAN